MEEGEHAPPPYLSSSQRKRRERHRREDRGGVFEGEGFFLFEERLLLGRS